MSTSLMKDDEPLKELVRMTKELGISIQPADFETVWEDLTSQQKDCIPASILALKLNQLLSRGPFLKKVTLLTSKDGNEC
jgi:hypothetical protein